ncbi:MAG: HEAT repeat domain-containing protein [Spirochaetota bacterium]|nr:HEAT repeat domain-containing protein [Spirochaetota bacterium]
MKKPLLAILSISLVMTIVYADDAQKKAVNDQEKSKSAKEYIEDLSSDNEETVITAVDWIGKEKEKGAVTKLTDLLKSDKRVKVRLYAAIALGLIGEDGYIDSLNEAFLNDSSADVRYSALLAIHRIGSMKSLDALKKAKESESDPFIKDYIEKMESKVKKK